MSLLLEQRSDQSAVPGADGLVNPQRGGIERHAEYGAEIALARKPGFDDETVVLGESPFDEPPVHLREPGPAQATVAQARVPVLGFEQPLALRRST